MLLVQQRLGDVPLGVLQGQLHVGAHHVALQLQLGHARLGSAHAGEVLVVLGDAGLTPPEVEGVAQPQGGIVVPGGGAGQLARAVEIVRGPAVAAEGRLGVYLGRLHRLGGAGQGGGHAHPRAGLGQARAAGQGLIDPGVQLRVAEGLPPALPGPAGILPGLGDGGIQLQVVGGQALFGGGDALGGKAAGHC